MIGERERVITRSKKDMREMSALHDVNRATTTVVAVEKKS